MGLPLCTRSRARLGPGRSPDFLHFFFERQGSTIAFFYYIGTSCPDNMEPHDDYSAGRRTQRGRSIQSKS